VSACGLLSVCVACGKSTTQEPRVITAGEPSAGGEDSNESGAPSRGGASAGAPTAGGSFGSAGELTAGQGGADEPIPPVPTLSLRAITISQTQEIPLMRAGNPVAAAQRTAPLIAGKRALVRAFVDVEAGFLGRPLIGVLDLKTPQVTRTLVSQVTVTQSSLQDELGTSFVFDVEAKDVSRDSTYRVRVLEADTTPLARFPETDYAKLEARVLPPFELVLVPFISNRFAPKTGETELTALRQRLLALFPSTDVIVSVTEPETLPYVVNGDGDGWDNALDHLYKLRAQAQPAHDVFYFGAMAPKASYNSYCTGGCILGFSTVAEEADVESRGSIGITVFQDGSGAKDAWDTLAHELGHAMGRDHAPCGISDPNDTDPDYPYANASMGGIYGYDFDLMKLVKPKPSRDVMSYCTPVWISDYTYRGIFDRLDYIASESFRALAYAPSPLFRLARIRRDGQSAWLDERHRSGKARLATLDLLDGAGQRMGRIDAQVVAVDHAPGGYVWLPSRELTQNAQSGAASIDLRPHGGAILPL
jgi:hypothetical protein